MPMQFNPFTLQNEWVPPPKVTPEMPEFGGAYSTGGPGGWMSEEYGLAGGMPGGVGTRSPFTYVPPAGIGTDEWMFEDVSGVGAMPGSVGEKSRFSFIPSPEQEAETITRTGPSVDWETWQGMEDFEQDAYKNQGGVIPKPSVGKKEIPETFKKESKESLKTVPKKTLRDDFPFGWGPDKEGVLSIGNYSDKFGDPQNEYEDVLLNPDTYTGTWRPFEDIFGEIPKEVGGAFAGMPPVNKKRNQLLKMREWYNEKSEKQRKETEKNWKQKGLPVGGFSPGTGEYIYTKDDFLDSKIGKEWKETNNPENKDITSWDKQFTPMGQQLQKAFDEWNNSSIESRQTFFDSGTVEVPSISAPEAEVVVEEEMGTKPPADEDVSAGKQGGREGYINAFIRGDTTDGMDYRNLGIPPETLREMAVGSWNSLSPDIQAQWGETAETGEADAAMAMGDGTTTGTTTTTGTGTGPVGDGKATALQMIADYGGFSLGDIQLLEEGGQLPEIPDALKQALSNPFIQVAEQRLNPVSNEMEDVMRTIQNPAIEVLFNIYRQQLDTQVEGFRQKKLSERSEDESEARLSQAMISATGGLAGGPGGMTTSRLAQQQRQLARIAATGGLERLTTPALQQFQEQQALIGATGGLRGGTQGLTADELANLQMRQSQIAATGGLAGFTPFGGDMGEASDAAAIQAQLFKTPEGQAIAAQRGLTPFEMAQMQLQPLRMQQEFQQAQEALQRTEAQRQFNEQLAIQQRQQELAELAQSTQAGQARAQLEQQRQMQMAQMLTDPTALATLSTLYGPGSIPSSTQIFGSPWGQAQAGPLGQAQAGRMAELNPAPSARIVGGPEPELMGRQTSGGRMGFQGQPATIGLPPTHSSFTPFQGGTTLTQPQFEDLTQFGRGSYEAARAMQGRTPEEQRRRRLAVTPLGTDAGPGGLESQFIEKGSG